MYTCCRLHIRHGDGPWNGNGSRDGPWHGLVVVTCVYHRGCLESCGLKASLEARLLAELLCAKPSLLPFVHPGQHHSTAFFIKCHQIAPPQFEAQLARVASFIVTLQPTSDLPEESCAESELRHAHVSTLFVRIHTVAMYSISGKIPPHYLPASSATKLNPSLCVSGCRLLGLTHH